VARGAAAYGVLHHLKDSGCLFGPHLMTGVRNTNCGAGRQHALRFCRSRRKGAGPALAPSDGAREPGPGGPRARLLLQVLVGGALLALLAGRGAPLRRLPAALPEAARRRARGRRGAGRPAGLLRATRGLPARQRRPRAQASLALQADVRGARRGQRRPRGAGLFGRRVPQLGAGRVGRRPAHAGAPRGRRR